MYSKPPGLHGGVGPALWERIRLERGQASQLEAAAMARPIVTTDVEGCREVVDDGINGLLC
jgi:glycosyltransferase involved in cell wall biosynthesis